MTLDEAQIAQKPIKPAQLIRVTYAKEAST